MAAYQCLGFFRDEKCHSYQWYSNFVRNDFTIQEPYKA